MLSSRHHLQLPISSKSVVHSHRRTTIRISISASVEGVQSQHDVKVVLVYEGFKNKHMWYMNISITTWWSRKKRRGTSMDHRWGFFIAFVTMQTGTHSRKVHHIEWKFPKLKLTYAKYRDRFTYDSHKIFRNVSLKIRVKYFLLIFVLQSHSDTILPLPYQCLIMTILILHLRVCNSTWKAKRSRPPPAMRIALEMSLIWRELTRKGAQKLGLYYKEGF